MAQGEQVLQVEDCGLKRERARIRIEVRDANGAAADIGVRGLRKAWQPPCLHYTPEFVRFQSSYPSSVPSCAWITWSGDEPVAFVAAMGRETTVGPMYLSSFYCALPGYGAIAPGILRSEVIALKESRVPCLVFAAEGSVGESIMWQAERFGRPNVKIGTHRVHMAAPRPMPERFEVVDLSPNEWALYADEFRTKEPGLLSPVFTPATLEHMAADPHGRRFVAAVTGGEVAGVAVLSNTHTLAQDGSVQILPTLNYVRLRRPLPHALSALICSAGGPLVTIPNTSGLDGATLRAARARATPASFTAVMAGSPCEITATDFEVV